MQEYEEMVQTIKAAATDNGCNGHFTGQDAAQVVAAPGTAVSRLPLTGLACNPLTQGVAAVVLPIAGKASACIKNGNGAGDAEGAHAVLDTVGAENERPAPAVTCGHIHALGTLHGVACRPKSLLTGVTPTRHMR